MKYNPHLHHRRSIRLKGHDYTQAGEYFVTIRTHDRGNVLGRIQNENLILSEIGTIVKQEWMKTPEVRSNVDLDEFVIMPNHVHGILVIRDERKGGEAFVRANGNSPIRENKSSQGKTPFRSPSATVGAIVRGFKGATTKRVNELFVTPGRPLWHRNYYEHVVRNEEDLERIREYIRLNPTRWPTDEENPTNTSTAEANAR
jgi:putative transposase